MTATSANSVPSVRHFPYVKTQTVRFSRGAGGVMVCGVPVRQYVLTCTCGRTWEPHPVKRLALADEHEHLAEISGVPEADRCRQPGRHRTAPFQRCPLCAGQLGLFASEDAAGGDR